MNIERDQLLSTFGMSEYEDIAYSILKFIDFDLEKTFSRKDITENEMVFTMFGIAGWLSNFYFPKGRYTVSPGFVDRLKEKGILK